MRSPHAYIVPLAATVGLLVSGCGSGNSAKSTNAAATSNGYSEGQTTSGSSTPAAATTGSSSASTSASKAGGGVVVTVKHSKLGTILAAGPKRLTVYLFEGDKGQSSNCSGGCAQVWPPVTTSGAPTAGSGAMAADLGTVTRADGTRQVTYKGHPLYFYAHDQDAGDSYGQGINGFGASWYVMKPTGSKLDNS